MEEVQNPNKRNRDKPEPPVNNGLTEAVIGHQISFLWPHEDGKFLGISIAFLTMGRKNAIVAFESERHVRIIQMIGDTRAYTNR